MITKQYLMDEFRALGLEAGDTIFVHSSFTSLSHARGGVEGGPQTVIDAMLEVLTPEGTLIMPTFNYDFLHGKTWDIRTSPSILGILTELVRQDARAKRMYHPTHSVAAIGKRADEVAAIRSFDCFGATSIYQKLRDWNAKILVIGLIYSKSITIIHHVEQLAEVDYRFMKEFTGTAIDWDGIPRQETISMYVRDVDRGVVLDIEPMGRILDAQVAHKRKVGLGDFRLLDANDLFDVAYKALKEHKGPGLTYIIETPDKARDWLSKMKPLSSLKDVLAEIYPLHRTLASDGTDKALEIIDSYMPEIANYTIETYAPLEPVWTWRVPERYVVHEAYLETEDGQRIVDYDDNPLHLVSYSLPTDETLTWDELVPHLYYNEKRPHTIPWKFKYYDRDWGFCLSKNLFDSLPHDKRYRAVIRAEFVTDPQQGFRVASGMIHPDGGRNPAAGEMIILSHICHPMQANDDAAGVVTALGIARRLAENPLTAGSMSIRFLFCPETIGPIAYLAHHEEIVSQLRGGIFLEMTGNKSKLAWHHSRQHNHPLDRIAHYVLRNTEHEEREFAAHPANDERVVNGPGVNVPCISLNRWPYDEYHTSDDNLDIIDETMLVEAADAAEEIIRIFTSNYIPKRKFRGPVFLSGHGLWVDWQDNWALNRAIEKMTMRFEGRHTVFDIVDELGLDYWETRAYIEKFRAKNLIDALPLPEIAERE